MPEPASLITRSVGAHNRPCARKQLRPSDHAREDLSLRLRNEAAVLAHLAESPGVIRLLNVEQDPLTLVLEWADGGSLDQRMRRPIDPGEAERFAREIVAATIACHARGVVHRDIKPSNVLIVRGAIRLADFGVAAWGDPPRALPEGWEEAEVGTPPWSAPELRQNATGVVSPSVDAYGVAKTILAFLETRSPVVAAALSTDPARRPTLDQIAHALG